MTKAESLTEFQDYIDDSNITDYHFLEKALYYLNNFFHNEAYDSTKSTVIAQEYVDLPDDTKEVLNVWVDDDEMTKLRDRDHLNIAKFESEAVERWYVVGDKLYFTVTPTAVETVKMKINKKFIFPSAVGDSYDCDDELLELVILGAVKRYYSKLLSTVVSNREDLPDANPDDIREAKKEVTDDYNRIIKTLRQNG